MAENALVWEQGLDVLADSMDAYAAQIERAVRDGAAVLAAAMEADAQANAPWQDQTGDARAGLHSFVEVVGDLVSIYLAHGDAIGYDLALELGRGGKYAIIAPTLEAALPRVWDVIRSQLQ